MGHDTHFLTRLDRVSLPHVELAMSLYNDTPLLQFVLGKAHLPDGAERVAISLDHPEKGPFLVVTRSGRFVTCLGEGMSAHDLPVITRSQLDAIAEHVSDLRARISVAESLVGKEGNVRKVLRRLFTAGSELSREEFIGISAWQPLLRLHFLAQAIDCAGHLNEMRVTLRKVKEHPKRSEVPILRDYWNNLWAVGHLLLLFAMDARELIEEHEALAQLRSRHISWPAVRQGLIPVSIRGAWAAGKLGKLVLGGYKASLESPSTPLSATNAVYGLTAIAARHSRLRGEIRKVLHGARQLPEHAYGQVIASIIRLAASAFDAAFDNRDELCPLQREIGGEQFIRQWSRFSKGATLPYASPAEVPENLALAAVANVLGFDVFSSEAITHVLVCLPWIAPAQPEDLYYPAEVVKQVAVPFIPELIVKLLEEHRRYEGPNRPVRAAKIPGRFEPCVCGSGKKYKRCCASLTDSEEESAGHF